MTNVEFLERAEDELLEFAVIAAQHLGKWVFCRHRERSTYEFPGGRREKKERIETTAKRELWEETGALKYSIEPVCPYSVETDGKRSYGMLYAADVTEFGPLPSFEIEHLWRRA